MGMGAGFGQSTDGQTGVGSSSTQSNAPTGGKGGGTSTPTSSQNPYASSQPQQPQPQPYQPMGGNAYGYNIQRLAQRMDPSATLPGQPPAQPQMQEQQAGQMGGKGGGQTGMFGIPQEYEPFAIDAIARSYGYQPFEPSFSQPVQGQEFQAQEENPFQSGFDAQAERMAQLERQLADLTARKGSQTEDTGEKVSDLPKPYEEFGVGETEEEEAAAEAEAAKPYQYYSYKNLTPEQNAAYGADKKARAEYFSSQTNKAKTDLDYAQKAYDKALESGDYEKISAARAQRDNINKTLAQIQADAKAAAKYKAPKAPKPAKPSKTPKAPKPPKTTTKKAAGGIIHKGMSSSLKKQLGTK